jgi:type II secretory pathway pseudopilin PulG
VLFIVSILVSFVTGIARHASRAAETRRAQADLHLLADALERYYLRFGDYPWWPDENPAFDMKDRTLEATRLLSHVQPIPGSNASYVFGNSLPRNFSAIDPWGAAYRFLCQGTDPDEAQTFLLYSRGPDSSNSRGLDSVNLAQEKSDDNITL